MPRRSSKMFFLLLWGVTFVVCFGLFMPQQLLVPVHGAGVDDWNRDSFWYEPWSESGVHKGIDIFGERGTPVVTATPGVVVYRGQLRLGGNVVYILGPKWRMHYYAHMDSVSVQVGESVYAGNTIGTVGTSGNAADTEPHLHYAIQSLVPDFSRFAEGSQGWKRMFYLNPGEELQAAVSANQ